MKQLIDLLVTLIQNAVTAGDIVTGTPTTSDVYKGYSSMPDNMVRNMYITLDDGGERIEVIDANKAHMRYYSVILEFGVFVLDRIQALDNILDLSNEIKNVIESQATQTAIVAVTNDGEVQYDNYCWGVDIEPFEVSTEDNRFYRVRKVIIDFMALEDRRFEY